MSRTEQLVFTAPTAEHGTPEAERDENRWALENEAPPEPTFPKCEVQYHEVESHDGTDAYHAATILTGFGTPEVWNLVAPEEESKLRMKQIAYIERVKAQTAAQVREHLDRQGFRDISISFVPVRVPSEGTPSNGFFVFAYASISPQ